MNDYSFGNYLYEKRKQCGFSQTQLAGFLGVTNKAVSKWENGRAKPTTDTLRKLAAALGTDIEEMLRLRDGKPEASVTKIVITGGPCAGKTTGMSWIQNAFAKHGYQVLFVPETATELISGGVTPKTCGTNYDFQTALLSLQLKKEEVFENAASTMKADKILIVCDRGAMDNLAYMTEAEFQAALHTLGLDRVKLRDEYDGVFHLVTAADGAEEFYTLSNNKARTETPEQARELDRRLIAAWTGHPHLRVIGNDGDFESKMRRLITEISTLLGEPEPYETERKFLIEYPDLKWLESLENCHRVDIIQTYLMTEEGGERRVRQRGEDGSYIYYETIKRPAGNSARRVEIERRLAQKEYLALLMEADPSKRPIRKTRYLLTWDQQYFEIDLYPFWKDRAILEIELSDENAPIRFPGKISVIREVTDDPDYRNAALASRSSG